MGVFVGQIIALPSLDELAQSGVYFLHHEGEIVYVGKGVDMRKRVSDHIGEGFKVFDAVSFHPCPLEKLDAIERRYIKKHLPKYNKCRLANFMRQCENPDRPVTFIKKRRPRSRRTRLVAV